MFDFFKSKFTKEAPSESSQVFVGTCNTQNIDYGAEWRKEQEARMKALENLGVDFSIFTDEKVVRDIFAILDEVTPQYKKLKVDLEKQDIRRSYPKLTKGGNVPKNVLTVSVIYDSPIDSDDSDSLIAHAKYLADGKINMIDAYFWSDDACEDIFIRTVNGQYRLRS